MSFFHALILGLVQGITEFFPVSSSAHLTLTKLAFGLSDIPLIFDLSCHLGSLLALVWFFRKDIEQIFCRDRIKIAYLSIALLPLFPCMFLLAPLRKFAANPQYLGLFLMGTGAILLLGQKIRIKGKSRIFRDVLLIGAFQSAALFPGISRSASTISCAQVLGWKTKEAVRFSFLLAIPTIAGANFLEAHHLWKSGALPSLLSPSCLTGFFVSFFASIFVIQFAIRWLEKGKFRPFAWYCLVLGFCANLYLWIQ